MEMKVDFWVLRAVLAVFWGIEINKKLLVLVVLLSFLLNNTNISLY